MKQTQIYSIALFIIMAYIGKIQAQTTNLFELGQNLIKIAESDNTDSIVNFMDPNLNLDKKAQILESFLNVRDNIFANTDPKKIKLFNVIKNNGNTLFIIRNDHKFVVIKSKTNENNQITEHFAVVRNDLAKMLENGEKIYRLRCYSCHKKEGQGGIGPNLTDPYWKYINNEEDLYNIIANGKKGTMMIAYKDYLTPQELKNITLYIEALQGKKLKNAKKPEGEKKNISFKLSVK